MDVRNILLYDVYKNLLNDSERLCFESYYFNNLSLSEISINFNISRNAIHKKLKVISNKLIEYEEKLNLYKKITKIEKLIKDDNLRKQILDVME